MTPSGQADLVFFMLVLQFGDFYAGVHKYKEDTSRAALLLIIMCAIWRLGYHALHELGAG